MDKGVVQRSVPHHTCISPMHYLFVTAMLLFDNIRPTHRKKKERSEERSLACVIPGVRG